MAKWREIERATIDGRVEDFEVPGGAVVKVRLLPLLPAADIEIAKAARLFAEGHGSTAMPGDPVYELGVYVHTILRAVCDVEDGAPFFASVEEMLDPATGLDRDRIALLFELQQQAQADFAPNAARMSHAQYYDWLDKTTEAEEGDALPFERSPRATQRTFVRSIARSLKDMAGRALSMMRERDEARTELAALRSRSATSSPVPTSGNGPASPATETSSAPPASPWTPPSSEPAPPAVGEDSP